MYRDPLDWANRYGTVAGPPEEDVSDDPEPEEDEQTEPERS